MPRSAIGSVEATDLENRNGAAKLRISCLPDPRSGPCFLKTGEGAAYFSIVQDLTVTLVLDARLATAIGRHIAEQARSRFFFPEDSPKPDPGKPLTLKFCARCHSEDGGRHRAAPGPFASHPGAGGLRRYAAGPRSLGPTIVWQVLPVSSPSKK